jgi:hypothetical protein
MTWAIFPGDKHVKGVLELLNANLQSHGSERIIAVVGGALLEEAVDITLRERLLDEKGLVDNLLGVERPLGALGPKIDLLRLLGAFDENTRLALKGIAGVRNFFAHHLDASFDSLNGEFSKAMGRLTLHQNRTNYPHHLFGPDSTIPVEPVNSKQEQFVVNLKIALIMLMRDRIGHKPHTNFPLSKEQLLNKYPDRYSGGEQPQS